MSMYSKMQKNIVAYYNSLQAQYSAKYVKEVIIGLGLLVALGGGYIINKWYVKQREEKAFEALFEVVHSFTQTQQTTSNLDVVKDRDKIVQAWQDTSLLADALYKEHSGSNLAPFFLVFQSEIALQRDHDIDAAIKLLDDALPRISQSSELGALFHMKRIKMGFDSQDEKEQEKSFKDLLAVSQDATSCMQQEALYVLGLYYTSQGQFAKGQETWQELVKNADETALLKSPWVALAQEKLGNIIQSKAE